VKHSNDLSGFLCSRRWRSGINQRIILPGNRFKGFYASLVLKIASKAIRVKCEIISPVSLGLQFSGLQMRKIHEIDFQVR